MSYSYTLYGLTIDSFVPLSQTETKRPSVDIVIERGKTCPPNTWQYKGASIYVNECEIFYNIPGVANFTVRNGREIIVDPCPDVDTRKLRHALFGEVLAILLHQRGLLVLHATSLAIHGKATILLGTRGAGKSTLALALCRLGATVISDDITVIQVNNRGTLSVLPGISQLGLWPDAVRACGYDPERLPNVFDGTDKRVMGTTDTSTNVSLAPKRIYKIEETTAVDVERLSPQEAFRVLVGNTYWFGLVHALDPETHFAHCASVAAQTDVFRLRRPKTLDLVNDVAQHIIKDAVQGCRKKAG